MSTDSHNVDSPNRVAVDDSCDSPASEQPDDRDSQAAEKPPDADSPSPAKPLTWFSQSLPTLLVMSALAGLGLLGHHYGWKIPKFSELVGRGEVDSVKWCDEHGYRQPLILPGSQPVYLRYPVLVEEVKKRDTAWGLEQLGVRIGVWFQGNIHPIHKSIDGCPNADRAVRQCINFPCLRK